MFSGTSLRDPVLINAIGHTAGALLFGLILELLIRDRQTRGVRPVRLSILAAALAHTWNVGSLIALAFPNPRSILIGIVMTISFSVLSLLPAVLLQVALRGRQSLITIAGYVVSTAAVVLHVSELFSPSVSGHCDGRFMNFRAQCRNDESAKLAISAQ